MKRSEAEAPQKSTLGTLSSERSCNGALVLRPLLKVVRPVLDRFS